MNLSNSCQSTDVNNTIKLILLDSRVKKKKKVLVMCLNSVMEKACLVPLSLSKSIR